MCRTVSREKSNLTLLLCILITKFIRQNESNETHKEHYLIVYRQFQVPVRVCGNESTGSSARSAAARLLLVTALTNWFARLMSIYRNLCARRIHCRCPGVDGSSLEDVEYRTEMGTPFIATLQLKPDNTSLNVQLFA